ncbi:hypothetical protein JCM33374_g1763 [Metschnikowia sp. JCM 33374]|nr:hypothetical protein JCM33374_g1763 [Metschnikowia sp. JCM 33374]
MDTRTKAEDHIDRQGESSQNGDVGPTSTSYPYLVENGPNGEVCIWYEAKSICEIWGWANVDSYSVHRETGLMDSYGFHEAKIADPETYAGDSLSLLSSFATPGRSVVAMKIMSSIDGSIFICAYLKSEKYYIEARSASLVEEIVLPEYLQGDSISLKASPKFLVVSSSKGLLYILKYAPGKGHLFVEANSDGSLSSVYSHSTRTLMEKYKLQDTSNKTILLKTGTFDGSAIYDIVGTWLVYCPKRLETEYFKNLMHSNDDSCSKGSRSSGSEGKKLYTSVKLPPNGPILFRAASSLANSAIDKIFKLSQIGTKKVKTYWNPDNSLFDKDISLHTISTSIGNALYSTASKIKKQADLIGENEIIKIIDLSNGQIMATFKPPGGISHLSLSEYDLQLAQATYRGDNFYIWDLYKLPNEVSFVGKFLRGKTSAVIKEIFWFVNNKSLGESQVTNSGFGCITKKTGSIHWYNINYLFCANENDNFPNTMELSSSEIPKNGRFLDSWILPSVNATKLLKIPGFSNVPSDIGREGTSTPKLSSNLRRCNQLAFVDSTFNLRLVSPLNGKHTFKYKLNEKPVGKIDTKYGPSYGTWLPFSYCKDNSCSEQQNFDTPLSQTEIETCVPFSSITRDKNVVISSYNIGTGEEGRPFWDYFSTFGNEVPNVVHEFTGAGEYDTPFTSTDDLTGNLKEGLIISPGNEED